MMEVIMKNRLPVEHFHFPVEKIKAGYYTDAYFLRTEEILNGDNHHPRVMMQLFTREPVVVCGIDETIALIKTCAHNPENITIHALHDGDEVAPWETRSKAIWQTLPIWKLSILVFWRGKAVSLLMYAVLLKPPTANRSSFFLPGMIPIKPRNLTAMLL